MPEEQSLSECRREVVQCSSQWWRGSTIDSCFYCQRTSEYCPVDRKMVLEMVIVSGVDNHSGEQSKVGY